ncbi:innexin 7 isoform X2 [Colletes latitarsis]|uniref:innexin 7 isoform X2 n=1 Tax=Colletes latitarsis TaxID=2605962 RepID=UPI0040353C7B
MAATTVLATFSVLKDHVKLKVTQDSVAIDNIVFKLHYRATFLILLICSLLVSSRQFFGEHIRRSSFTCLTTCGGMLKVSRVIQGASCNWNGGRLKMLVSGLQMSTLALRDSSFKTENGITVPTKQECDEKIQHIRVAFINRIHLNRPWAYYLGLCEVLNFINVLSQIYFTDWFLGGAFMGLGQTISDSSRNNVMDPLDVTFPKVTKCIFHKYGPSGTIQEIDALCVMALNIVNEKIYVFLWFWFIILAVITGCGLIWRLLTMALHARSTAFNKIVFSMACPGKYNPWNVLTVTNDCHYGDWLFLYYIAKNLDNYVFKDLLQKLAKDMQAKREGFQNIPSEEEPLTHIA